MPKSTPKVVSSMDWRRVQGFAIDYLLLCVIVWACFHFRTQVFDKLTTYSVMLVLGKSQIIAWKVLLAVFGVGPAFLFLSFLFFSASPGQYLRHIREVDAVSERPVDIGQALILSFCFMPAQLVLRLAPQFFSLLNEDRRTLIELLAGTKARNLKQPQQKFSSAPWKAYLGILLSLFSAVRVAKNFFPLSLDKSGVVVGGTSDEQSAYLKKLLNPEVSHEPKSATPELCFDRLRGILKSRNRDALIDTLTLGSQLLVANLAGKKDLFEDLPRDVEFARREGEDTDTFVKIYYHEVEGTKVEKNEYFMTFAKENGDWKIDLLDYIRLKKMQQKSR